MVQPAENKVSYSMSAKHNALSLQISVFLFAVFGAVLLGLIFVSYNAIKLTDGDALARQQRFAARSLDAAMASIPQQQRSATVWDDAVLNVAAVNQTWMDDNLGVWMQNYFGHHENYILDQANRPVFASVQGEVLTPRAYDTRAEIIAPLVVQMRQIMSDIRAQQDDPLEAMGEVAVVAPLRFNDEVSIVSLVPIISDSGELAQAPGSEALHIALRRVDSNFAQEIGQTIELEEVAFSPTPPVQPFAGTALIGPTGDSLAWLVWKPERPGMDLFVQTWPFLLLLGLVGSTILLWFTQRLLRVSRQLQDSETQARLDLAALEQAREAAKVADQAKMNFMSVVSHELRTPLTVILGYARLGKNLRQFPSARQLDERLLRQPVNVNLVKSSIDEVLAFATTGMEKIEKSGEHLLFLVNQLLDYAKMETGSLEMHPELCNVQEVLEPVVEQMRVLTEQKGLDLETQIIPCTMLADIIRTRQIVINLMGNAIKFTDSGKVSVIVTESDDKVHIAVSDTGIGIEPHELDKIFFAFHQTDLSFSRSAAGTGLGLTVARELAQRAGGNISVQSTVGHGSTFTLSLPKQASSSMVQAA